MHKSDFNLHDYGQRITYIGGEVSYDNMGAGEYNENSINRALTAFGLMSRDKQVMLTEVVLDFSELKHANGDGFRLYENAPRPESWVCFHAVNTPPLPGPMRWLRAKSAPCLISTVGILPLGFGSTDMNGLDRQPKLLYLRKSVVGAIRKAVKLHVFDKAHALAEEYIDGLS